MKAQATAKLRKLRVSPRKVRLLIDLIRNQTVESAKKRLQFSNKAAALPVRKLLDSAVANAKINHNIDESTLVVKTAFVDGGAILYRWMPRAFGRASKIRKRTSHITIILEGEVDEKATKAKITKKEDAAKENNETEAKKESSIKDLKKNNSPAKSMKANSVSNAPKMQRRAAGRKK